LNRVCNIFSQLLQFFPRLEFEQAVGETRAERHARGFTCWGQFVAMLFCQLGQARCLGQRQGNLNRQMPYFTQKPNCSNNAKAKLVLIWTALRYIVPRQTVKRRDYLYESAIRTCAFLAATSARRRSSIRCKTRRRPCPARAKCRRNFLSTR
jgi:Domain of unknown function (DUF4372)